MKIRNLFGKKPPRKYTGQTRKAAGSAKSSDRPAKDTRYELWGRDTFEGRSFICREFEDYEEACSALMRCRQSALSQDEELRDAYWLVRVD